MLSYPQIDPVAFALGPLTVHWYGLMYLVGFIAAWLLALRRSERPWSPVRRTQVEDLVVYGAFGVILGGRLVRDRHHGERVDARLEGRQVVIDRLDPVRERHGPLSLEPHIDHVPLRRCEHDA